MFVIGLTGGIGTGKTEVSNILRQLGAEVMGADEMAHLAYQSGSETWSRLRSAFGDRILTPDGEVDRRALGSLVFDDPEALRRLNEIVHPAVKSLLVERLGELDDEDTKVAVVEVVLLLEAGWQELFNEIWVVTADEDMAVDRTASRSGMTAAAVRSRIGSQMPQTERAGHADVVLSNNGTLNELQGKVERLWRARVPAA